MKIFTNIILLLFLSSCATGINPKQRAAYQIYKEKGLLIEDRNPDTAFKMGFLPGGSSFYNKDYDVAVFNLLLWPISITWETCNGSDRAMLINYVTTETSVKKEFKKNLVDLEDQQNLGLITQQEFKQKFIKLYEKYSNSKSFLLSQYKSANLSFDGLGDSSVDTSFLSKIDIKINRTCNTEYNSIKKEFPTIDKENFMHKCSIDKRKKFVGLGL